MIDIHSHILYNVDDGSKTLECTLEILRKAEQAGFSDVVLTPHYIEGYYNNTKSFIKRKISELKQEIYKEDIIIDLHQGNEIMLTENTPDLLNISRISTIANSRYVLFEVPLSNKMLNLNQIVYVLKANGYIPIIAHPERYAFVQENPNEVVDLIKSGVLIQSNYGSFMGQYGKNAKEIAELLLENHLIHFLGTDTHRHGFVYENMMNLIKHISEISGDKRYIYEITTTNPRKVLNDLDIYISSSVGIKERRKIFFFF